MFGQAASLFMNVLSSAFSWFETMLNKGSALGPFIAAFFIYQVGRFLLRPIFGSVGSDRARSVKGRSGSSSGSSSSGSQNIRS